MLKAQDEGVRSAAGGLLKKLAVHGELLFCLSHFYFLLLTIVADYVRASNFESTVILPVLGMLMDSHTGVKTTASGLLKAFAIHGGLLHFSIYYYC